MNCSQDAPGGTRLSRPKLGQAGASTQGLFQFFVQERQPFEATTALGETRKVGPLTGTPRLTCFGDPPRDRTENLRIKSRECKVT